MHMNDKITVFTKGLLDFMYWAGILTTALVPAIIHFYGRYNSYFAENDWQLTLLFLLSGALAVLILHQLRQIFGSVLADDCFVMSNVASLRRMGNYAFGIAALAALRIFLYLTPSVIIVILTFVIAGLFSKVLAVVFEKAITYKLENDLTI